MQVRQKSHTTIDSSSQSRRKLLCSSADHTPPRTPDVRVTVEGLKEYSRRRSSAQSTRFQIKEVPKSVNISKKFVGASPLSLWKTGL